MKFSASLAFNALIICILAGSLISCRMDSYHTDEGIIWNTSYHITYESSEEFTDSIVDVMEEVDNILSPFNPRSSVSALNSAESMRLNPMLADVFAASGEVWRETGGRFDPTAGPLINAYGFGTSGKGEYPSADSVREMLAYVGLGKVRVKGDTLLKPDRRMQFNFSALAKGYGCDRVAALLERHGVRNLMVEIGGEIVVRGKSPRGGKWRISVDKPIESAEAEVHESQAVIEVTDCAVATSGNYRNFRDDGGRHTGHIVDPLTGLPAETEVASATVVARDCMTADAYATACMALPADEALVVARRRGLAVYLIMKDGTVRATDSFRRLMMK